MRLARLQREARRHERHALFLHAPGDRLIEEGIDTLSRDDAAEVAGPASSQLVRDHALRRNRAGP